MGFLKKLFGSRKKEEENVDDGVIDNPIEINYEEPENKEEINDELIQTKNFKYLDDLIHSGVKKIILDADIALDDGEESEYEKGIKLDVDDLVIDGNEYSISAERKTRIFEVTGKNIILKNITLKNGHHNYGGAIYNKNSLEINNCNFNGNVAQDQGGAIYNREAELTVTKSILTGNLAQKYGGAIYHFSGELTISDSTLTRNTAKESGGAICLAKSKYFREKELKYESENCTFKDNNPDDVYEEKD